MKHRATPLLPCRSLGAMYACQIFKAAERELPGLSDDIAAGKFGRHDSYSRVGAEQDPVLLNAGFVHAFTADSSTAPHGGEERQRRDLKTALYQRDFLLTWKQSDSDLRRVLHLPYAFVNCLQHPCAVANGLVVSAGARPERRQVGDRTSCLEKRSAGITHASTELDPHSI